jgi:hypothetical protein
MDVCPWSGLYVVSSCVGPGLATSRSLVQGALPYVVKYDYETELTKARAAGADTAASYLAGTRFKPYPGSRMFRGSSLSSSVPPGKCVHSILNYATAASFHILSNSLLSNRAIIQRYTVWGTEVGRACLSVHNLNIYSTAEERLQCRKRRRDSHFFVRNLIVLNMGNMWLIH